MDSHLLVRQIGNLSLARTRTIARRWRTFADRAVSSAPNLFPAPGRSRKTVSIDGLSDHILKDIGLNRLMLGMPVVDQISRRHE